MTRQRGIHATLGLSPVHGEFFLNQKKSTRPRFGARRGPHHSTPPPVSEGRLGSSGLEENKKGGVPSPLRPRLRHRVALRVSRLHRPPHRTAGALPVPACISLPPGTAPVPQIPRPPLLLLPARTRSRHQEISPSTPILLPSRAMAAQVNTSPPLPFRSNRK